MDHWLTEPLRAAGLTPRVVLDVVRHLSPPEVIRGVTAAERRAAELARGAVQRSTPAAAVELRAALGAALDLTGPHAAESARMLSAAATTAAERLSDLERRAAELRCALEALTAAERAACVGALDLDLAAAAAEHEDAAAAVAALERAALEAAPEVIRAYAELEEAAERAALDVERAHEERRAAVDPAARVAALGLLSSAERALSDARRGMADLTRAHAGEQAALEAALERLDRAELDHKRAQRARAAAEDAALEAGRSLESCAA